MKSVRILIAEDEGIVALDLKYSLISMGFQVVGVASTGQDAVRQAEQFLPDLILMDIRLQGEMDGVQAASKIMAKLQIPVIYLSAMADKSTIQRAMKTMPHGFVTKPFLESELRAAIEEALE
ncbi:MAG: response regulator [Anaerolineales bacterium]|nr:response regulator [Chloroflexota bacterium]MBL6981804.1 response regulator [Anaerolineales bacterium]